MTFISDIISKLPVEIVFPLAITLALLPIIKFIADTIASKRSHNRELLQQMALHLEKYSQDQNKVSAFFIEEAARSRYGAHLLLSEILYFIEKSEPSHRLYDYSRHKPYVAIKDEKICFLGPASAIIKLNILNLTWKELKGYTLYFVYSFIGVITIFVITHYSVFWTILKWFLFVFFIGKAASELIVTDKMRDARKYVEGVNITQSTSEKLKVTHTKKPGSGFA